MVHNSEEITLLTSVAPDSLGCAGLQGVMHCLRDLAVRGRLPPVLRQAAAVSEPAGRATWRIAPSMASPVTCTGITILTANLWHDFPRHRGQSARLERFARLVEEANADILLLQEVSRRPDLHVDDWLARRLGMAFVYARANGHAEIGFEEGLAVFSRFPLDEARLRVLSPGCNPFVRRLALGATIRTACGPLQVVSVHLALARRKNWQQINDLCAWIEELPGETAMVVGGDFNVPERSLQMTRVCNRWIDTFRHLHPFREAVTHEVRWPWGKALLRHRLDYLFLRPGNPSWQVVDARLMETPGGAHSDHRSMLAHLAPQ
jgi:endonuclease/exonuclease/phosphatase family metal-dependent hydrolase